MTVRSSAQAYFQIRPTRWADGWRLYAAYALALLLRLAEPHRFRAVGLLVVGRAWLRVSYGGILVFVRPRTNDLDLLSPSFEPLATGWLRVRPGEVVVDVGAHIGKYTLPAAKVASKIIAIEPDPSNISVLQANVRLNHLTNVTIVRKAISDRPGIRGLYLAAPDNTGTSSLEPDWYTTPDHLPRKWVSVECLTLDDLLESLGVGTIDWLKIDVEAHEVAALRGAYSALRRTRHLVLEVAETNESACRPLLEEAGLDLVAIEPGRPTSNWLLKKVESAVPSANSGNPL